MTPIRHKTCGAIAMWYVGPPYSPGQVFSSNTIVYLDGTRPAPFSAVPSCPECGEQLSPFALERCFDEDLDPGFDIEVAMASKTLVYAVGKPDPAKVAALMRSRALARVGLITIILGFVILLFIRL